MFSGRTTLYKRHFFAALFCVLSLAPLHAAEPWQSNVIQGFSEWQAGRVKKLLMEQSFSGLTENTYAQALFPNTVQAIDFNGSVLVREYINLLPVTLEQDMDRFQKFGACLEDASKIWVDKQFDGVMRGKLMVAMIVDANSVIRRTLVYGEKKDKAAKGEARTLSFENDEIVENVPFPTIDSFLNKYQCEDIAQGQFPDVFDSDDQSVAASATRLSIDAGSLDDLVEAARQLKAIQAHVVEEVDGECQIKGYDIQQDKYKWINKSVCSVDWLLAFVEKLKFINDYDAEDSNYYKVYMAMSLLEYMGAGANDWAGFKVVQRHGLFFAGLMDANDKESGKDVVIGLLDNYVDEQAVYNRKNDDGALLYSSFYATKADSETGELKSTGYFDWFHTKSGGLVFLGSHFGAVYWESDDDIDPALEVAHARPFGPVGLELKLVSWSASYLSVTAAPIDIGAYVYNELNNEDYNASFSDISSPSYYMSWTFKKTPISLLAGYQEDLVLSETVEVDNYFVGIAYDLPIFTFF